LFFDFTHHTLLGGFPALEKAGDEPIEITAPGTVAREHDTAFVLHDRRHDRRGIVVVNVRTRFLDACAASLPIHDGIAQRCGAQRAVVEDQHTKPLYLFLERADPRRFYVIIARNDLLSMRM